MAKIFNLRNLWGFKEKEKPKKTKEGKVVGLPAGRVSMPESYDDMSGIINNLNLLKVPKLVEAIPLIRNLYKVNEDVGQVIFDLVRLSNTGHKIKFDQTIDPKLQDKMRKHLKDVSKKWAMGTHSIDGLVNKLLYQIWVSGAISFECAPSKLLTGIERVHLVNPENIVFSINRVGDYDIYQKVNKIVGTKTNKNLIKLNKNTYKYLSLGGDEDTAYGIPPFITALKALSVQKDMKINIKHILNQMGLLGYLEIKLDKPMRTSGESENKYESRLTNLLHLAKQNIINGFKDGVVAGFKDDHEFQFHSTTKNLNGVTEIFDLNQKQIANGLKTASPFLGIEQKGGEGQLGIVFTKMISQLKNTQEIVASALEFIYNLELLMAGFNFSGLEVEFKPSTITDDLKIQQSKEIKQRILRNLWIDNIISSDVYAEEMGYKQPHKNINPQDIHTTQKDKAQDQEKKEKREKDKDTSDRRVRDKNKPQPKRKDTETKER